MRHFLLSIYGALLLGLVSALGGLWYYWYMTGLVISSSPLVYISGITLLNVVLAFFAHDKHRYVTLFIYFISFMIIGLTFYSLYTLSQGII